MSADEPKTDRTDLGHPPPTLEGKAHRPPPPHRIEEAGHPPPSMSAAVGPPPPPTPGHENVGLPVPPSPPQPLPPTPAPASGVDE